MRAVLFPFGQRRAPMAAAAASPSPSPLLARAWWLDLFKLVAAWCIVAHHALRYGPMAQALQLGLPAGLTRAAAHGRLAVQVFLVVGGYLALKGLRRGSLPLGQRLQQRYQRLVLPFAVALGFSLGLQVLLAPWLPPELAAEGLSLPQVVAHVLLLQDVLGYESLTVGAWYVAIDWQLYALLAVGVMAAPRRWGAPLLAAGVLASAWGFNRISAGDAWAPYFFAAYGLGALAALNPRALRWTALGVAAALAVDFRGRLALALGVALLLAVRWPPVSVSLTRGLRWGGERAYALFLLHFPVLIVANACFLAVGAWVTNSGLALLLLGTAALLMTGLADAFHRRVELPLQRRIGTRRSVALPA